MQGPNYPAVGVANEGTGGSTVYGYCVIAFDPSGNPRRMCGATATGHSSLDGTNYNRVSVGGFTTTPPYINPVGACDVYCDSCTARSGKIGTIASCKDGGFYDDKGGAGDANSTPADTSGGASITGPIYTSTIGLLKGSASIPSLLEPAALADITALWAAGNGLLNSDGTLIQTGTDEGGHGLGNVAVPHAVTFSATPTFSCNSSTRGTVDDFTLSTALSASVTSSTLSGCTPGQALNFTFTQAAAASYTVAMPTNFDACPVSATYNVVTTCSYWWDGTHGRMQGIPFQANAPDLAVTNMTGTGGFAITGNAGTATNLASYPTVCSGGQFSQGLSSGSNNCASPAGSGTVTVVSSGALVNHTFMTGGGTTTSQTETNAPTLDSSGNVTLVSGAKITAPGGFSGGSTFGASGGEVGSANGVTAATYTSGISATGTGTCLLTFSNGGGSGATASIAVTVNTPGAITILLAGIGFTSAPTAATVSNGTLTCTGPAVLTSTIAAAADSLFFSSSAHVPQFEASGGTTVVATEVVPAASRTANEFLTYIDATGTQNVAAIVAADLPTVTIAKGGTNATSAVAGAVPNTSSTSASSWTITPTLGVQNTASANGSLTIAGDNASTPGKLLLNIGGANAYPATVQPGANAAAVTLTLPATTGTLARTADNITGYAAGVAAGTAGALDYQSAANTTGFITAVAAGQFLVSAGLTTVPAYSVTPTLGIQGTTAGALTVAGTSGTSGTVTLNGGTSGSAAITASATGVLALPSGATATNAVLTTPTVTTSIADSGTSGTATVGVAGHPFGALFIGGAATNNIKLTGTSAAARIYTIPDVAADTDVELGPTTATANLIRTSTSTAGLSQWSKVTLTPPTTAWTITPAADNQTTTIPAGTLDTTTTTKGLAYGGTNVNLSSAGGTVNTSGTQLLHQNASHVVSASALALQDFPAQAQDTVLMNVGASGPPAAQAMPTCATGADLYNTSTHSWSCVATGGGGTPTLGATGVSLIDYFTHGDDNDSNGDYLTANYSWRLANPNGTGGIADDDFSANYIGSVGISSGAISGNDSTLDVFVDNANGIYPAASTTVYTFQGRFALGAAANNYFGVGLRRFNGLYGGSTIISSEAMWCDVTNTGSAGIWACHTSDGGGTQDVSLSPTQTADLSWHVIKITVTSSTVTFYFDGVSVGSSTAHILTSNGVSPVFEAKTNTTSAATIHVNAVSFNN
jgi:hypothetical protein